MTLTLTRAGSNVPTQYGRLHYYWPHASGLCHLAVYRPSTSFQAAPVAIFVHGEELGCKPGWGSMTNRGAFASGYLANLAQALSAAGWVVVTIDYPTCSIYADSTTLAGDFRIAGSWREHHPTAFWPEQPTYVARAVQHVKSNWSGITGPTDTIFGKALWGTGNSVDPAKTIIVADKWGATMAMWAALQPTGWYPFERGIAHETMDRYVPRASSRVAALVLRDVGPVDFTQFYVNPSVDRISGVPDYLRGDRFGPFMRCESQRRWGSGDYSANGLAGWGGADAADLSLPTHVNPIHPQWKRQSPWWLLNENHAENANLPMHIELTGTGYGADDASLASTDWNPGFPANDTAANKCWMQPHDGRIQGPALASAFANYGGVEGTGTPIRSSVVAYPASTATPLSSTGTYAANVLAWLELFGL